MDVAFVAFVVAAITVVMLMAKRDRDRRRDDAGDADVPFDDAGGHGGGYDHHDSGGFDGGHGGDGGDAAGGGDSGAGGDGGGGDGGGH